MITQRRQITDTIDNCPRAFTTRAGTVVRFDRAKGPHQGQHFVLYFADRKLGHSREDMQDIVSISIDFGKILAAETYGNPENYSITINGLGVGSWNEVEHVNLFIFESRTQKIAFYKKQLQAYGS